MRDLRRLVLPALRLRPPAGTSEQVLPSTGGFRVSASVEGMQRMFDLQLACGAGLLLLQSYELERFSWGDATTVRAR